MGTIPFSNQVHNELHFRIVLVDDAIAHVEFFHHHALRQFPLADHAPEKIGIIDFRDDS
jgi:hypothetical protein